MSRPSVSQATCDDGRSTDVKDALYTIALKNADRYEALARRAETSSDEELAEFFRRMRDESRENAERAKRLLAQRVAE
jgi:rubrerythrin